MIKLSIITPYYNTFVFTKKLSEILSPQLTEEVEWIIVDDGTEDYQLDELNAKIIHLNENSGNASRPRNIGLDNAKGKYITFIDSDDLVESNYIEKIINKIDTEDFDYCYISWKTKNCEYIIKEEPPEWNCCVWNCIYKKDIIGNERFNENYNLSEDKDFNIRVRKGKRTNIEDILYIYNWKERENSLSSLCAKGIINFIKEK
ncbi:MAG: glycosyltransferase [Bacilli bacterium]|nr:glycosyltransferase [Bacilli bacterium]